MKKCYTPLSNKYFISFVLLQIFSYALQYREYEIIKEPNQPNNSIYDPLLKLPLQKVLSLVHTNPMPKEIELHSAKILTVMRFHVYGNILIAVLQSKALSYCNIAPYF